MTKTDEVMTRFELNIPDLCITSTKQKYMKNL